MAFYGKVALISGGASGIGKVHARQLASQGAEVVILDIDDLGLEECSGVANNISPFKCDVSDLVDVRKLITKVDKDSSSHFPEYDYPNSQQKE